MEAGRERGSQAVGLQLLPTHYLPPKRPCGFEPAREGRGELGRGATTHRDPAGAIGPYVSPSEGDIVGQRTFDPVLITRTATAAPDNGFSVGASRTILTGIA